MWFHGGFSREVGIAGQGCRGCWLEVLMGKGLESAQEACKALGFLIL